jgi:hypothetical protein
LLLLAPSLDATSFENGYPTTEELMCSAVSEERVCNSCQRAFRTQFHMEPPSPVFIYTWYKKFEQKGCICKNKSPDRPCVWCNCGPRIIVSTSATWLSEHISSLCEVCTKLWEFFYRLV